MTSVTNSSLAVSASSFTSGLGINTHLGSWEPLYENPNTVLSAMQYLGISNARDSLFTASDAQGEYNTLANAGIKFDFIIRDPMDATTFAKAAASFAASHPGALASVEGPNEVDIQPYTYNGSSSLQSIASFEPAFYKTIKATPGLSGVPVLDVSISQQTAANLSAIGNVAASADYANSHAYVWSGAAPYSVITDYIQKAQTIAPGKPVIITETGYNNTLADGMSGVSETVQAKYTLDTLFDAFAQGVAKTYLYEVFDESANKSDPYSNFGLYHFDGTPKIAANALHNLTTILADPHSASPAAMTSLTYTLSNLPSSAHSLVLEKSDGHIDLVVWAEPNLWNSTTHTEIAAATTSVGVSLGGPYAQVQVFDPLVGTAAQASYANASSLSVNLSDHPLIIELSPGAATSPTPPPASPPPVSPPPPPASPPTSPPPPSGQVIVAGAQGSETLTGTSGADVFQFKTLPWTPDHITGFQVGVDKLDLHAIFPNYTGSDPVKDGYVTLLDDGRGGTNVLVNPDGHATAANPWPTYVVDLDQVSKAGLTSSTLLGVASSDPTPPANGGGSTSPTPPSTGGGSTVYGTGYGDTVAGGTGNDTLVASTQGTETLTGGAGADVFRFKSLPWTPDHITDFQVGVDKVDLHAIFPNYTGSDPVKDGYVTVLSDGHGGTNVLVNPDGHATAANPWPTYVVDLDHVSPTSLTASAWLM